MTDQHAISDAAWKPRANPWLIAITVTLATFMEVLDTSIANVALPHIAGGLGASNDEATWVLTSYLVANAIILPASAYMTTFIGRKKFYMICVILFGISSMLCGLAPSLPLLIFFRVLQGAGGGGLAPSEQAILADTFPPEKRGQAFALYGMAVVAAPAIGPTIGGYITDNFDWRWIFFINVPVAVISLFLTSRLVEDPPHIKREVKEMKKRGLDLDYLGFGLLAVGFGSLEFFLDKGQEDDWFSSKLITGLTVSAFLGFFFFIWRELTAKNPIVELRVLKNGNLRVGTILSFILGFGLYGSTFIIPLYTQSTLGWTAQQAGLLMVPAALTTAFMMPIIGQMLQRGVKQQYLVALGMLIFFLYSFWGYKILTPDTGKDAFFWMLIFRGFGLGMLFIPITTLSLSTLKGQQIGQGAAFTGMMRQLGGSFGVALITTFMASQNMVHRSNLVSQLSSDNPVVQQRVAGLTKGYIAKGMAPDIALKSAYQSLDYMVMKQATVLSYMDVFLYLGVLFLICIPFVLMVKGNKQPKKIDMAEAMH